MVSPAKRPLVEDAPFCRHIVWQCLIALPLRDTYKEHTDSGDRPGVLRQGRAAFSPEPYRSALGGSQSIARLSLPSLAPATPSTPARSWAQALNGHRLRESTPFSWADRPSVRARLSGASSRPQAPNRLTPVGRCCSGPRLCMIEHSHGCSIWRTRTGFLPGRP